MSTFAFHRYLQIMFFGLLFVTVHHASTAHAQVQEEVPADVMDAPMPESAVDEGTVTEAIPEDTFFDSGDLVPQGEMASSGPVLVDPNVQRVQRQVIVQKNFAQDSKTAQLVSAERAMKLGRNDSALQLFDILYEGNKKDSRVLMGRAVVLQKLGRFDEAMQMYEALSTVEPDNLDVKVNMLGLLGTRFPAVALRNLLDLYAEHKGNAALAAQIGVSYAQNGDAASSLQYLGVAASMEPKNASHYFNMAVIADRAGEADLAIKYYEKALEVDTIHGGSRTIARDAVYTRLADLR